MGLDVDAIVCYGTDLGVQDDREDDLDLDELWERVDAEDSGHLEPVFYCNLYEEFTTGLILAVAGTVQTVSWRCKPLDTTAFVPRTYTETAAERHGRDELRALGIEPDFKWLLAARHA